MKTIETNAASTPAITKFEVGKTYVARPDVDFELNMTVVKRTNCYVSFVIEDGEIDETVYKRKVANICGVEKICYRETNAIIREYEFSAKNEVATAQDAVKADETADTVNLDGTTEIGDETVKFFNGKFHSVFSRKYHGAIVDANGIISYCVFNDGDTEIYDVSGHEVSYDDFIAVMTERAEHLPDSEVKTEVKADEVKGALRVTFGVYETFNLDDENEVELLNEFEAEIREIDGVVSCRIDESICVICDGATEADIAVENVLSRYGFRFSRYVWRDERVQPKVDEVTATPEITVWDDSVITEKPSKPETVTVKTSAEAWDIIETKFPGKFVLSSINTHWSGIRTVTFRNEAGKFRLDVLSDTIHNGAIYMTVATFDNEITPVFEIEVTDDEPRSDRLENQSRDAQKDVDEKKFAREDELNEIGEDIIDTREILERKVVEGASQAELENLAEYIADRNREYADLYKAAYGEEPAAGDIDLDAGKILNRAMDGNEIQREEVRHMYCEVINETVDGKYQLIEICRLASLEYRLEDEHGHRLPLRKIDYLDWKTDNFGELFDAYGDLRYDEYGEYPIDDVNDRLEDYHTLSLWYDN